MNNLSRIIALILSILLVITVFTACGNYEEDNDSSKAKTNEKTEDKTNDAVSIFGETNDDFYYNDFAGFKFELPEGWRFYDDDEIAQLLGVAADMMDDEELIKLLENGSSTFDMFAVSEDQTANVNVTYEKMTSTLKNKNDEELLDFVIDKTVDGLESMSVKVVSSNKTTCSIGGKEYPSLELKEKLQGFDFYQKITIIRKSDYSISVCISGYDEEVVYDTLDRFSRN